MCVLYIQGDYKEAYGMIYICMYYNFYLYVPLFKGLANVSAFQIANCYFLFMTCKGRKLTLGRN